MKILGKIPKECYISCSGGVDSMSIVNYVLKGNRDVTILYYNHNTPHGHQAEKFLSDFCLENQIKFLKDVYKGSTMTEQVWREARYNFLSNFKDKEIIQGHNLSDNIETWLFSSVKGTPKFIPYRRDNIIRPFLLVSKEEILKYANNNNVKWIEDPSNKGVDYDRNKIRNKIIPVLKDINPGLNKTFRKKCLNKYQNDI